MRDIERIDRIIEKLRTLWHQHPDWRMGQLFFNLFGHTNWFNHDPFYVEDNEFEKILDEFK